MARRVSVGWVVINPKTTKVARTGPTYGAKTGKVYGTLTKAKQVATYRGYPHENVREVFYEVPNEG